MSSVLNSDDSDLIPTHRILIRRPDLKTPTNDICPLSQKMIDQFFWRPEIGSTIQDHTNVSFGDKLNPFSVLKPANLQSIFRMKTNKIQRRFR